VTIAEIVFYLLALLSIVAAVGVVTVPNVVHAALFLILTLMGVAGFYILLSSEFLALVQILIYAGAVSILLLFGLMLTRGQTQSLPSVPAGAQWPIALLSTVLLGGALITAVLDADWPRDTGEITMISLNTLASALFRDWLMPFEIVSIVLLVALVGAVVIAHHEEEA
jgi:NADH-quinone oxidoreductase subunit J